MYVSFVCVPSEICVCMGVSAGDVWVCIGSGILIVGCFLDGNSRRIHGVRWSGGNGARFNFTPLHSSSNVFAVSEFFQCLQVLLQDLNE